MTNFNRLHRLLEAAKVVMIKHDDDFGEIQTILDLYEKMMNDPQYFNSGEQKNEQ